MGRFLMTSVRAAEHFWWLRMFHYLFVIPFFPKEEGGEFEQLIAFENGIQCLVLLCRIRVGKSKRIHCKGSRAGSKAKLQQKSWKSLLVEHNELPWQQMCCSPFPEPWSDTHWCCRGHSHVCRDVLSLWAEVPWLLQGIWVLKYRGHRWPTAPPTHCTGWAGVTGGSLRALCRATTSQTIPFFQSLFKANFFQDHISSSEDPVE